jgi:hypothetical protein
MRGTYRDDRAWSDRYLPELRRLIGPFLLVPSELKEDREQATDLVTLRGRDLTIACRVRRPGFSASFPDQFTVRVARTNGAKTEYEKFIEGWGDWMFYGHATGRGTEVCPWWLIDLAAWRYHLIVNASRRQILWGDRSNSDGQTAFRWFRISSFPREPSVLVSSSRTAAIERVVPGGIDDPPDPTDDFLGAVATTLIGGDDA